MSRAAVSLAGRRTRDTQALQLGQIVTIRPGPLRLRPDARGGLGLRDRRGGLYVYRFLTDDEISQAGFDTRCTKVGGRTRPVVVAISNLPTGQLTYFDSSYDFRLTNTGSGAQAR
jgi:hypothetical protein